MPGSVNVKVRRIVNGIDNSSWFVSDPTMSEDTSSMTQLQEELKAADEVILNTQYYILSRHQTYYLAIRK